MKHHQHTTTTETFAEATSEAGVEPTIGTRRRAAVAGPRTTRFRSVRSVTAAVAIGSMLFAACSSDATRSAGAVDTTAVEAPVEPPTDSSEAADSATAAPVVTNAGPITPSSDSTATSSPATSPPATTPPATSPPATDPPATAPPATSPPATDAPSEPAPSFVAFSASNVSVCAAPDVTVPTTPRTVSIEWEITGADSIYVAVDNADGPYETDLPAVGSIELFVPCPGEHVYFVVAENAAGRTVMEATR